MSTLSPTDTTDPNTIKDATATSSMLFYPENGVAYSRTDYSNCCSQQPLELIPDYLLAGTYLDLKPPVLYYGFLLGQEALWEVIRTRLPESVQLVRQARRVRVEGNPGEMVWEREEVPDVSYTLRAPSLPKDIARYLQIPDDFVSIGLFAKNNGGFDFGLALGSNYAGVLQPELHRGVREFFGVPEDAKPMWHLNPPNWHWTPLRKRTATSTKATLANPLL